MENSRGKPQSITLPLKTQWVSARDIAAATRMSRATIFRMAEAGTFPAPIRISPRVTRWSKTVVEAWIAEAGSTAAGTGATNA